MAKGDWYHVADRPTADGVLPLAVGSKRLHLAPGRWRAQLAQCGLEDEVIAGSSDTLKAAIAAGDKAQSTQAKRGSEAAAMALGLPAVEVDFDLTDALLPLGLSLVLDRGQAPEMIEEFRTQIIAKAPAGTTPAIVTAALTAAFPDLAVAVAVASLVAAVDRMLAASFGSSVVLNRAIDLVPTAGGVEGVTLCLTHLPDPRSINVGTRPQPADFGLDGKRRLVETRRGRSELAESEHAGWVPGQRSWALLTLTRLAAPAAAPTPPTPVAPPVPVAPPTPPTPTT